MLSESEPGAARQGDGSAAAGPAEGGLRTAVADMERRLLEEADRHTPAAAKCLAAARALAALGELLADLAGERESEIRTAGDAQALIRSGYEAPPAVVEALRTACDHYGDDVDGCDGCGGPLDRNDTCPACVDAEGRPPESGLRAALAPFAAWKIYDDEPDDRPLAVRGVETRITVGDVRRARAALAAEPGMTGDGPRLHAGLKAALLDRNDLRRTVERAITRLRDTLPQVEPPLARRTIAGLIADFESELTERNAAVKFWESAAALLEAGPATEDRRP